MALSARYRLGGGVLPHLEPVSRQRTVPLTRCWQHQVRMGIGTDCGAGTTFSMLRTLGEAYKVGQLQSYRLRASEAFITPRWAALTPEAGR